MHLCVGLENDILYFTDFKDISKNKTLLMRLL